MLIGGSRAYSNPAGLTSLPTYGAVLGSSVSVGTSGSQLLSLSLPKGTFLFLGNIGAGTPSAALTLQPFFSGISMIGSALAPNYSLPFSGSSAPNASIALAVIGTLAAAGAVLLEANTTTGTVTVLGALFTAPTYLQAIKIA